MYSVVKIKYCLPSKGEQCGVHQCPGIIILFKVPTNNLSKTLTNNSSKKSILGYSLHFTESHDKFQKGPPMFLFTYNICIEWNKLKVVCL